MATALDIIDSARYDLIDEKDTQYSDGMLLDFLNRGIRPLCVALSALKSDWVNDQTTLTLSLGDSSTELPESFISDILVFIGTTELSKKSISYIRNCLRTSTAGEPSYYAIKGTDIIFEREALEDTTITLEFNSAASTVANTGRQMPFNDEFNDVLRQFIIMCAKNRNKQSVLVDAAIQDFFYSAVLSKLVARNFTKNTYNTDF